jgi:eukaryotic-like serine/threonine-protein kinase
MGVPNVGDSFGPYVIEAPAGQGGMGVVFRAKDTRLGRTVALKLLRADGDHQNPESVQRFLREGRIAASLSHPHIATVYEVGEHGGLPFLAMEWIDGRALRTFIKGDATTERRLELLALIAEAIAYAHESHVLHRDLKPGNVMVDKGGWPKILDFGLGKRTKPAEDPHPLTFATADDAVLGTPSYMAPEQVLSPNVDARADQYSWGVMAYELLARVHPRLTTRPDAAPFPEGRPAALRSLQPELSRGAAAVVERAMQPRAEERFATMRELASALRAAAVAPEVLAPPRPARARSRLAPFLVVALGTILVGGGALALFAFLAPPRASRGEARPPEPQEQTQTLTRTVDAAEPLTPAVDASPEDAAREDAASAVPADAGPTAVPRARTARVELQNSHLDLTASHQRDLDALVAPCFRNVSLGPGRSVWGQLTFSPSGEITRSVMSETCRNVPGSDCRTMPWVPKAVRDCVEPRFVGLRLPVKVDKGSAGVVLGVSITQR